MSEGGGGSMREFSAEAQVGGGMRGFTLVELLVVLVIIAILALQVVTGWNSPVQKVKTAAFNLRGDFNLARAEAVKRNVDVLVDFMFKGEVIDGATIANDGYRLCLDKNSDNACTNADTAIDPAAAIKVVLFPDAVRFYDRSVPAPDGPGVKAGGGAWTGDPVSFVGDYAKMQRDGTCNQGGTVYLYVPDANFLAANPATNDPAVIDAAPFALVVSSVGRVRLARWRPDASPAAAWSTK